ncbi:MAG TPA: NnrS family protein [Gammaproteobacteria bacterium]|nr:NnrS family protein [Gammaproteobacteria bacterium]HRP87715.1 NnrS family protein [Gammaproteobacteria bacterium]
MSAERVDRWAVLTSAPHRMFFATGLAWLAAWSAWWMLVLGARAAGIDGLEPARPALLLHGAVMLFLVLPPFMYGFLLTVFPRWMPAPPPGRAPMLAAWWLLNAGNLALLAGLAGPAPLQLAGWLSAALALAVIATTLLRILLGATERASHAFAVLAGLCAGLAGMLLYTPVLASGDFSTWPLVRGIGLWGFLLVVYFGVSHRMIPFFTSRVVRDYVPWRPAWILYLFVACALLRAGLELAPAWAWLGSVPLAGIATACALRWRPRQRSGVRLLEVLHISLAWLAIGLLLAAAADLAAALGAPGVVGRAPLHAIGMGFIGGMLMAMVTRVTLGHSGRPLVMDALNWRLFLVVQAATVLRIAGEFLPGAGTMLSAIAALAWAAAFGTWTVRHLPIYLRPRADGAPG